MTRKKIQIDQEKCVGCGLCVNACHEGAIGMVDGKSTLLREDYCDGLGNCLPVCPTGALRLTDRENAGTNETDGQKAAVQMKNNANVMPCGCAGNHVKTIKRDRFQAVRPEHRTSDIPSKLNQWPVQIKLVPVNAPYFENAHLLVAADCTAYAYGNFHNEWMRNKITLIGCPKLDEGDYSEKLTDILAENAIKSVTVARMEVPCCSGMENAVKIALKNCGKMIPWQVVVIATDGGRVEC